MGSLPGLEASTVQMIADPGLWGLGRLTFTLDIVALAFSLAASLAALPKATAGVAEVEAESEASPDVPRF